MCPRLLSTAHRLSTLMTSPKVDLKNRWLAAVLAFLVPGAGHLYQRRIFKSLVYFFGILGMFFSGMAMSEWTVVYWKWEGGGNRTVGYYSQVLVGLPALSARYQALRYTQPPIDEFHVGRQLRGDRIMGSGVDQVLDARFTGRLRYNSKSESIAPEAEVESAAEPIQDVFGQIRWSREDGICTGTFEGVLGDGQSVSLAIFDEPTVTPRVFAHGEITLTELRRDNEQLQREFSNSLRYVRCSVRDGERDGMLEGTVPRQFWDWYQVPLEDKALEEIHGRLGRHFELAQVFTWIAGLLNLLAIWDAYEGPAYGYGDEDELAEEESAA